MGYTRLDTIVMTAALGCALCLGACDRGKGGPMGPAAGSDPDTTAAPDGKADVGKPPTGNPLGPAAGRSVVWKRGAVVERDLMRALELPRETLCNELGTQPCAETHLTALGGNEPFEKGQYTRIPEPSAVTPGALERLVMGACAARVEIDKSGHAKVFKSLSLNGPTKPKDAEFIKSLDAQHVELFRRLLSRDPTPDELTELRALAHDEAGEPISGAVLATLSCFVIGTHVESVFL